MNDEVKLPPPESLAATELIEAELNARRIPEHINRMARAGYAAAYKYVTGEQDAKDDTKQT